MLVSISKKDLYNDLVRLGIKDKHWIEVSEDVWAPGLYNENYRFGNGYLPILELGGVEDIDSWLAEFKEKAKQAGLEKVRNKVKKQFAAFLENK